MNANRLTETNLKELDEKIQKQKYDIDKRAAIRAERAVADIQNVDIRSQYSQASRASKRPSTAKPASVKRAPAQLDDLRSQKSFASRNSRASVVKSQVKYAAAKNLDNISVITPSIKPDQMSESDVEEEDEWTAIMKFNAVLHYEEQKQAALREKERKRLLVIELDAQRQVKDERARKLKQEDNDYFKAEQQHMKLMDEKEIEKVRARAHKIQTEKVSRDDQLKKTQHKRRKEARENMEFDQNTIKRLMGEMDNEK